MLCSYKTLRIFYSQVKEICKIFMLSVYFMLGMMEKRSHPQQFEFSPYLSPKY